MSFSKKMLAFAAVSALTAATAVPAMALENEFHGLYRAFGFVTNAETGGAALNLRPDAKTSSYIEQRARLMYIAKANDNLRLVTQFELDSRWGGMTGGKYQTNDAGGLDADQVTLETKNVYLDFNCPLTGANVKIGMQPFTDSYKGVFGTFDGTGLVVSKKMNAFTPTFGFFRFNDNNFNATTAPAIGKQTEDMVVLDGKFAVNKDLTVGASYYLVQRDAAPTPIAGGTAIYTNNAEILHMVGVNAAAKFGPAAVDAFAAYQFGEINAAQDLGAYMLGATAKVKAGPGTVNLAGLYLSGEDSTSTTGDREDFQLLASSGGVSYYTPSNMWILIRNGQTINSSASVLGTDLTAGGRGLIGLFAGYEVTAGKVFYNANIGYAMTAEERGSEDGTLGTEINATVGYKMYDNLAVSATAAYAFLGDGLSSNASTSTPAGDRIANFGGDNADDPYLTAIQFNYTF